MNKKHQLEHLLELPEDESYAEYIKLSQDEKREFDSLVRAQAQAEHYKNLTMEAEVKLQELENELKQKEEEYKRLKNLH